MDETSRGPVAEIGWQIITMSHLYRLLGRVYMTLGSPDVY